MLILGRIGRLVINRSYATFKVSTVRKGLLNGINSELDRTLIEAQELVHYSMMVLNQTRASVIEQLKEIYGGHHRLLESTENANLKNVNIQMRELILLLMSKITHEYKSPSMETESLSPEEIAQKQLTITEIIELIYKTNLLHQTIANHKVGKSQLSKEDWDIHYNNKLAILFGDFYVARAWAALGRLRNDVVNQLMAQGIVDFTEGQFIMQTEGHSALNGPGDLTSWEKRNYLMNASLPGHACQSVTAIAGCNLSLQEKAFNFGKYFSLCWQALNEMEPFLSSSLTSSSHHNSSSSSLSSPLSSQEFTIDLMSLPVVIQMANSNDVYKKIFFGPASDPKLIDLQELYNSIINKSSIDKIRQVKNLYADKALSAINSFARCDASCALVNILNAMKET